MAKKVVTTRVSAKQKQEAYKTEALAFINQLRYPTRQLAFSVKTYEVTPTGKKPNALPAPEVAAIAGTARNFGKELRVAVTGFGDTATLEFTFVDSTALPIPAELL